MARRSTDSSSTATRLRGFTPATKKWLEEMMEKHEFADHRVSLLVQAAQCLDMIEECNARISSEGLTIAAGEGSMKPHPCLSILSSTRASFIKLLRALKIDGENHQMGRPPRPVGVSYKQLRERRLLPWEKDRNGQDDDAELDSEG